MAKSTKAAADQHGKEKKVKASYDLLPSRIYQLKYIAFHSEKKQTEILDEALADYIAKWEKKHGAIPVK